MRNLGIALAIWLVVGLVAAGMRGHLEDGDFGCDALATVAVTAVLGPVNFLGVDPRIRCNSDLEPTPRHRWD